MEREGSNTLPKIMSTQTAEPAFFELPAQTVTEPVKFASDYVIPYAIRSQFRDKVQEYFELTSKHTGSYARSEQQAIAWFEQVHHIPPQAWNYRIKK